jgi:arachidonate 15-lipoxygenase
MVGSAIWNYQLWTYRQPIRLYKDGRREPLDVYQRLVNFNYMLHVNQTPLIADYSYLALPGPQEDDAKAAFRAFKQDLENCEHELRKEPWAVWKLYPSDLKAHIEA